MPQQNQNVKLKLFRDLLNLLSDHSSYISLDEKSKKPMVAEIEPIIECIFNGRKSDDWTSKSLLILQMLESRRYISLLHYHLISNGGALNAGELPKESYEELVLLECKELGTKIERMIRIYYQHYL